MVLALYCASIALGLGPVDWGPGMTVGVGFLVFLLAAIAGKRVGIAYSHHRRAVLLGELERRVSQSFSDIRDDRTTDPIAGAPGGVHDPDDELGIDYTSETIDLLGGPPAGSIAT